MAAYKNDADAQYNLGVMYRDGMGVDPDPGQSMYWFRQAADNGDPVSAGIVEEAVFTDPPFKQAPPNEDGRSPLADDSRASALLQEPEEPTSENWIRQRDPGHYTIQVIALQNPDKLQMFIGQHPDWAPFAIYQQQLKGKPIYVLIQGDYADVQQAQEAVRMFPPGFQKREELWIRRFIMVQGLLP
jgi:septal ring-binding cell division protein DamX